MKRREFIAALGGTAAWPVVARAQQQAMPVIGILNMTSQRYGEAMYMPPLLKGLAEQGFVVGRNVAMDYRWADNDPVRLPQLAADLVRRQTSLIVAGGGTLPAQAARAASTTIPIVFTSGYDPVKDGVVQSLNHPGGNTTGVMLLISELGAKRLALLHELLPGVRSIGVLTYSVTDSVLVEAKAETEELSTAAERLNVILNSVPITNEDALDGAFAEFVRSRVGGVLTSSRFFGAWAPRIALLAARYALPTLFGVRHNAQEDGGLASYGPDVGEAYRQAGIYAARILHGEKAGDLPVVRVNRLELVINLKTAKALGVEIPPQLLARADEVIE
jgi:putative ABC transport system substrate-binding protein